MTLSSHIRRANRPQPPSDQEQPAGAPPEETTWQRYSPNGESVISGLASLLLHAALLGIILAGAWAILDRPKSAPVAEFTPFVDENGDDQPGGGQANKNADGLRPGAPPANSDETKPVDVND